MTKYQMQAWVFITSLILLTGFKKNTELENIPAEKPAGTNNHNSFLAELVKVSIAEATVIKGDKGQRPVKAMVYLSKPATEPVTVKYSTENGTAKAGVDYVATNGSVTFEQGEAARWITVSIIGEVAADPDEDAQVNNAANFIIRLSQAAGAIIDMGRAYITIIQNITGNPSFAGSANQAVYEVMISYTGYTSFAGTAADCGIRRDGVVVLSGYLSGKENVASDDDILYTGNLEMNIDIDICSIYRPPGISEDKFCGIRVNGSGKVYTELEIYTGTDATGRFDGRGGYIKIENRDGLFRRTVTGGCLDQNDEEWTMVPNKSISSVFNGKELTKLVSRTLRKGIYTDTDDEGNTTVVEVLRKIR
jgi:hypothetical protein